MSHSEVLIATMPSIPGYKVKKVLGLVCASSIRTRGVAGRFLAGLEATFGGKGHSYLVEVEKARNEALEELKRKAAQMGANAILSVDFETAEVMEGFIMVSAYGTAVVLESEE